MVNKPQGAAKVYTRVFVQKVPPKKRSGELFAGRAVDTGSPLRVQPLSYPLDTMVDASVRTLKVTVIVVSEYFFNFIFK